MSDGLGYTGSLAYPRRRRKKRTGRGKAFLVLVVAVIVGYGFWTTRDSYRVGRLLPADQRYWFLVTDALGRRAKVAESKVWQALPELVAFGGVPQRLNQDLGLPAWVLNNLVGADSYFTGNDLEGFRDVLFVTKMTRIGTLLERFSRLSRKVQRDYAGGLNLRKLAGRDVYYGVRGRVLVISPSRNALIRALTLTEDECATDQTIAETLGEAGVEDLRGSIVFATGDPLGDVCQSLSFAMRIDELQARVKCRGLLCPAWETRLARLLEGVSPQPLLTPPAGLLAVSANLGKPVRAVWTALEPAVQNPLFTKEKWQEWETAAADGRPGLPQLFAAVIGPLGPGFRLAWCGVDLNEMFPAPELVGTFDAGTETVNRIFEALPPVPEGMRPWDTFPRYDPERQLAYLPMIGGPSLEPTAAAYGQSLLVSSSRTVAEELLAQPVDAQPLSKPGNVYVRVEPRACVQSVVDVGLLLAENGVLKGHTPDSFKKEAEAWLEKAGHIDEVTALAAYEEGRVSLEFTLTCNADTP